MVFGRQWKKNIDNGSIRKGRKPHHDADPAMELVAEGASDSGR
jgi:hypothetical protein